MGGKRKEGGGRAFGDLMRETFRHKHTPPNMLYMDVNQPTSLGPRHKPSGALPAIDTKVGSGAEITSFPDFTQPMAKMRQKAWEILHMVVAS